MLFYITFIEFKAFFAQGVHRKIQGQVSSMERELGKIFYTGWSYPKAVLMREGEVIETEPAVTRKDYIDVLITWFQKYKVTQTYIRYSSTNKWFMDLLKYQYEHGIKSVLEITTYPYDIDAMEGIVKLETLSYIKEVNKYINRIATYSSHHEIWGLPCFNLVNGINIKEHPISNKKNENKKIVFIAVSTMQYWHGYERILKGMYLYYKDGGTYDLKLKLIGSGPEEDYYKELVEKYYLQSRVEFLGRIEVFEKEKLDLQYNLSDMAVGSLGFYKALEAQEGSPIKGSEYCARGIPFMCGYRDLRFPSDWEFMLNVSNNSESIDMNRVIDFYEKVTLKENYKELMRDYAEKHLTWDKIMEPVVSYYVG